MTMMLSSPSNRELRDKYIRLALEAEDKANRIKNRIRARVEKDIRLKVSVQPEFWKARDVEGEIDFLTSKACSVDPDWKAQVTLNQWYTQYATMFATAHTGDCLEQLLRRG